MGLTTFGGGARRRPRLASPALLAVLAAAVGGCNTDEIVAVTDPNQLRPADLNNRDAVPALAQGAIRQFVGGYSGFGDDAFVAVSGVLTDEYYYGDTFPTRQAGDSRNLQPTDIGNFSDPAFNRLQQARINARRAAAQVARFTTPGTARADSGLAATMRTIEGYTYVTLSEGWCGSIPFSFLPDSGDIDPTAIVNGEPLTTAQMNDSAVVRFDLALALDGTNNLARLGKARALLNNGRFAQAAAAVATVPTTYVYRLEHSANTGSQNNPIFTLQSNGRYGVANLEGGSVRPDIAATTAAPVIPTTNATAEGLAFRGALDPRIPWESNYFNGGVCFSSSVRCFLNDNHPDLEADVPLASGVEARLIEAEAALQAGDVTTMLAKLNALRADVAPTMRNLYPTQRQPAAFLVNNALKPLPALTDPGTAEGRRDLLFSERAFWLFNTGHRQGDLRRLVRQYGRTTQQVFPSGAFFRGGTYGNDVAFPVPFNEQNNPRFNPAACSTTSA